MDTQRVHHTDNSYPFNRIGTNARAIVNCSLKNRRTRVESNKFGANKRRKNLRSNDLVHVKLTASNRVVSACHLLGQILIRPHAASWFIRENEARLHYADRMFFAWRYCIEQSHLLLYTGDPVILRVR
jgi:hypothetical protein